MTYLEHATPSPNLSKRTRRKKQVELDTKQAHI